MQIDDKVKIKGNDTIFTIDLIVNGEALLKRERDNKYLVVDWYHLSELKPFKAVLTASLT